MDRTYSVVSTLSATAIAQNTAFIAAIKDTETIRDSALQVTQRMSGSITFEGHRSISYTKLRYIFSKYGKRFKVSFQDCTYRRGVHIDCFELLSHSIPHPISFSSLEEPQMLSDSLANFLDATTNSYKQSGSIIRFSLSMEEVSSEKLEAIFSLQIILDIVIFPDHLAIDIILPSDNKGGLSDLKMNKPHVFMSKKWTLSHLRTLPTGLSQNQTSFVVTTPPYTRSKNITSTTTITPRKVHLSSKARARAITKSKTKTKANIKTKSKKNTTTNSWPFLNQWF